MAQIVKSPSVHGYLTKLQCWYYSLSCSIHAIVSHYLLPSGKLPLTNTSNISYRTYIFIDLHKVYIGH